QAGHGAAGPRVLRAPAGPGPGGRRAWGLWRPARLPPGTTTRSCCWPGRVLAVERKYRGGDVAGRAGGPSARLGRPPDAPPAPPDGRASAAATPGRDQHRGVADPRGGGPGGRDPEHAVRAVAAFG